MNNRWKTVEFCTNGKNFYQNAVLVIYPATYPSPYNRNSFWVYESWDISYSTHRRLDGNNKRSRAYKNAAYYATHHAPPKYSFEEAKKAHVSVIKNARKLENEAKKEAELFKIKWESSPLTANLQKTINNNSITIANQNASINKLYNNLSNQSEKVNYLQNQVRELETRIELLSNELSLSLQNQKPELIAQLNGTLTRDLDVGVVSTGSEIEYKTNNGTRIGVISKRMMPGGFDYMFKTGYYIMDNGDKIHTSDITKLLHAYVGVMPNRN
jgi:uncharacterized coiled-coil protein SlyX